MSCPIYKHKWRDFYAFRDVPPNQARQILAIKLVAMIYDQLKLLEKNFKVTKL
jgi:hypothetical protein